MAVLTFLKTVIASVLFWLDEMNYKVESIGASFSSKEIANLAVNLSSKSNEGWELHTVFSVQKTGCFGRSEGTTYLAIYRREN